MNYLKWASLAGLALAIAACQPPERLTDATVLKGVTVIDGLGNPAVPDQTIVISEGKIEAIYTGTDAARERGADILDLDGRTVLPGLINGHVHLGGNRDAEASLKAMLALGVTGVRDMGGASTPLKALNELGATDGNALPTIYYSGTLAGPAFRNDPRIAPLIKANGGNDPEGLWFVDEGSDIAATVALAKADGAAGLKLYTALDRDLLATIIAEADRQELTTWVHGVVFPANTTDAVDAMPTQMIHAKGLVAAGAEGLPDTFIQGVQTWIPAQDYSLETLEAEPCTSLFTSMAENQVALEPALVADGDVAMAQGRPLAPWQSAMRDWACEATRKAHQTGVVISAGTDYFGQPGLLHQELQRLVDCGLSPIEAISAATYNNAIMLGIAETKGSLTEGMVADLLVIGGDASQSIDALKTVELVIKGGTIVIGQDEPATE